MINNFLSFTYGIEKFLPYEESEKIVHKQKFKNAKEYYNWKDRPYNIPSNPNITYKNNGWEGFGKYLGTGNVAPSDIKFLPYEKAKKIVCKKGFKNVKEYWNWKDRPDNIPFNPHRTYKNKGWEGWGKYLGTETFSTCDKEFLPYEESEKIVCKQKFKNVKEYNNWKDRPYNIPSAPNIVYKNRGWKGWGKYLGTGTIAFSYIKFLPYEESEKIVCKQKFKSAKEYYNWKDRPYNIPSNPDIKYKNNGWEGFGKYLGNENKRRKK